MRLDQDRRDGRRVPDPDPDPDPDLTRPGDRGRLCPTLSVTFMEGPQEGEGRGHQGRHEVKDMAMATLSLLKQEPKVMLRHVKQLVKANPQLACQVFTTDVGGWTPVHACALRGKKKAVKAMLHAGVEVNARMGEPEGLPAGCTLLHVAANRRGHDKKMVDALLHRGAEVNARDSFARTPLYYARRAGNKDATRLLLDCGAVSGLGTGPTPGDRASGVRGLCQGVGFGVGVGVGVGMGSRSLGVSCSGGRELCQGIGGGGGGVGGSRHSGGELGGSSRMGKEGNSTSSEERCSCGVGVGGSDDVIHDAGRREGGGGGCDAGTDGGGVSFGTDAAGGGYKGGRCGNSNCRGGGGDGCGGGDGGGDGDDGGAVARRVSMGEACDVMETPEPKLTRFCFLPVPQHKRPSRRRRQQQQQQQNHHQEQTPRQKEERHDSNSSGHRTS